MIHSVKFQDGTSASKEIYLYVGACFVGDPTAYCIHRGQITWIVPGESVAFVEHIATSKPETIADRVRRERDALVCG